MAKATHTARPTTIVQNATGVAIQLSNGHQIVLTVEDGWLIVEGDSILTVRPVNERKIYVRPVGYVGPWIPDFAAKPRLLGRTGRTDGIYDDPQEGIGKPRNRI